MNTDYQAISHRLREQKRSIILIGFMGSGKSSLSLHLAKQLQIPLYDTDSIIVKKTGLSIPEIFQTRGEDHFRQLEKEALLKTPQGAIIATGGGIVEDSGNRQFLKSSEHIVIWLNPNWEILLKRIEQTGRPKVLTSTPQELYQLWQKRLHLYRECARISYSENSVTELLNLIARNN